MWKFQGNINGTVDSQQQSLPMVIKNHRITNVSGASVNVNIYMITGGGNFSIAPYPQTLAEGQMYYDDSDLLLNINDQVRIATSGSVDYLFNIDNTQPPL